MNDKISIPNKSHFTFDEVALITGVKKYVLRFWETEFSEINPIMSSAGQKLFEHKDIEAIFQIKKLLFDQKLSIEKAKAILSQGDSVALTFDEVDNLSDADVPPHEEVPVSVSNLSSNEKNISTSVDLLVVRDNLKKSIELADSLKKRHNWK